YFFRVRSMRAADSSSFSGEVKATACPFASAAPVTVGSLPTAATAEDLNGDGIQDVALLTTGGGNLVTLLGQGAGGVGTGNFAAPVSVPSGPSPVCLALLDANGDGVLDAVVGAQDDNTLYLHLGQGDGTFGAASPIATLAFSPTGIATGDFDEDGVLDLAVAGGGASIALLLGRADPGTPGVPNGTFAAPVSVNAAGVTRGILAYDWNGDGITDLATSGAGVRLLYGNGTNGKGDGTFSPGPAYSTDTTPNQMTTGDFNGDGIADLVVCNLGASTVSVFLGHGWGGVPDGTFAPAILVPAGTGPSTASVADWDQDGRPDLAVGNASATSILLGQGNGTFEAAQAFPTGGSSPLSAAVNDFNEDGAPDILACNRNSQSVTRQLAGCVATLSHALAIVSPNGGETWTGNQEHVVTWTKGVGVMTVDLQRSDDSGAHWRTLARGLVGTSYAYTAAAPWTTHVRFRVVESHAAQFADA